MYATVADLETRYGAAELAELTNRAGGQDRDDAVLLAAIGDASAEIDGYLASRYAVPVSPVPPVLVGAAAAIARYKLRGPSAGDTVRRDYEDAIRLLRDISDGRAGLQGAAAPGVPAAGTVHVDAPARRMSVSHLSDYTAYGGG